MIQRVMSLSFGVALLLTGWASAYDPGVMQTVVEYRLEADAWRVTPPHDWYMVAGYVAAMDCSRVGEIAYLVDPSGKRHRVLIADCAGDDGPIDRFDRHNIIVELDAQLWARLTSRFGRPLRVSLEGY